MRFFYREDIGNTETSEIGNITFTSYLQIATNALYMDGLFRTIYYFSLKCV